MGGMRYCLSCRNHVRSGHASARAEWRLHADLKTCRYHWVETGRVIARTGASGAEVRRMRAECGLTYVEEFGPDGD